MSTSLGNLSDLCDVAKKNPGSRRKNFQEFKLLAHELRGQGGTFGCPLINTLGKMLCDATRRCCCEDNSGVKAFKAHVDSMRAVNRDKISGDGGQWGRELLTSFELAIERNDSNT